MKFVYVLEDDPKFQQEICEAISFIDPKIQIRLFPKLENFAEWVRHMMTTGPAAIAQGGAVQSFVPQEPVPENDTHQLVLIISKIEFLGARQLSLLKKTRNLFIERKICTAEDPTAIVLTAFDNPEFDIKQLESRILNNVILKPFDRLILMQHLTFAIDGRHPPSKYAVANQKTTARVEMLKDVEIEAISDVGFVTRSYREIKPGAISKYYGPFFRSERHRSLFAVCRECLQHPDDPKIFRAVFTYFAADPTQISSLRRLTRKPDAKPFDHSWIRTGVPESNVHIILLDEEEEKSSGLSGQIQRQFGNVRITSYHSFGSFLSDLDPEGAVKQRDPALKTLGGANLVTLNFDSAGTTFLNLESDKKDLVMLFGAAISDFKDKPNWFSHAIPLNFRDRYRKYVQSGSLQDDNVFPVSMNDNSFLIKVTAVNKAPDRFQITFVEPDKNEQIEWLRKNSRLNEAVHLIIANHRLFGEGAKERWGYINESLQQRYQVTPVVFMTTKRNYSDSEEKDLGEIVQDIFFKPVDQVYFFQKMKSFLPQLRITGEPTIIKSSAVKEIIKTATPVDVSELSEAGVVMQYYRPINLGSFREFVLWQPYEIGAPELLATCNFVEESPSEKGIYNCHMVYFGISDIFLKHIRIWIRDNYVLSKEGGGG